ncbi:oxygenase MpaB family protein [Aldersonia kunmingensis]|uniref:oxygenase MpaB family protein n=1 Tax=Aldersonia kunmingensis TaxID=408066 RepID=UPI00082FE65B|nr:oxygenase MpaB family protein [Aldersonia kunmingensis]
MTGTREIHIRDFGSGFGLMLGGANVIMQLSRLPVGHGVVDSPVESGNVFRHPVKRLRTTVTYLAVALEGTEAERAAYREAVNGQHRQVKSAPGNPVRYNAFDPHLQLWVAACLYKGTEDQIRYMFPDASEASRDEIYRECERLATTLQVPAHMWPADRDEFERYWKEGVAQIEIDDTVRTYLDKIARVAFLPRPISLLLGPYQKFITIGFLPPEFRAQMHYRWTPTQERRFNRLVTALARLSLMLPAPIRNFPSNAYMWDMRRRMKAGRPLV